MMFSPLVRTTMKAMLMSTFFISTTALSADISMLKKQAQQFSEVLNHSYLGQVENEAFRVTDVNHQFIYSHGLTFTISTNFDDINLQGSSRDNKNERPSLKVEEDLITAQANKKINELHFQVRNLAHQEFSLQKQISSMQSKSLHSNNEQAKEAIDKTIRSSQDTLKNTITQKKKASQEINRLSEVIENSTPDTVQISRETVYSTLVNTSIEKLCNNNMLLEQLADNEQVSLIFKNLGKVDSSGHQDNIVNVEKSTLLQCNQNEISNAQALKQSYSYHY